jgi:hypothetical protein
MNVRDIGARVQAHAPERVLEAVGLAKRPMVPVPGPNALAAFGLGLLVGIGLGLLLQVTTELEDEGEESTA